MTTHQSPEMRVGDGIGFFVKSKALHVFDAQGNRLAAADKLLAGSKVH
jgi:iron(III) transport system ATP-binding protein